MEGVIDPSQPLDLDVGEAHPEQRDPNTPITITATPAIWKGIHVVMMEAPMPGRIVAPLANVIAGPLVAAGHQP